MSNEKFLQYAQLAVQTAEQITKSLQQWTDFLTTAGRLYKYPYHEQLMIFAQRPEATACATYDLWNNTMGRYVRRGSHGIALLDTDSDQAKLKYVFDVSDTGGRERSRSPYLWTYQEEHYDTVSAALEQRYDIPASGNLPELLEAVSRQLAADYWENNRNDILGIVDGSFLEDYDDLNIGTAFRTAATVSTTYLLLSRCGLESETAFTHEDFLPVFDFNTPATVAALGTAVSQNSEQVLRQIEATIKNYEREKLAERTDSYGRTELQQERGLFDPQPDPDRAGDKAPEQVRADAEAVSEGASPGAVEPDGSQRNPVSAPAGDRRDGEPEAGADHAGADGSEWSDGGPESNGPDVLDGADEQPESPGRGNDSDGADLQLTQSGEIASAGQIELFPSEAEQIQNIIEAESVNQAPSALSFSQADIDAVLLRGSGIENGKLRIYAMYQHETDRAAARTFLKEEYGPYSGHSHTFLDGTNGFATYTAKGLNLRRTGEPQSETNLTWIAIEKRLRQLVAEGQYLNEAEQAQYAALEREYAGFGGVPSPIARSGFPAPEQSSEPEALPLTQDEIDDQLRTMFPDTDTKRAIVRYMNEHGREREAAAWLASQYYGSDATQPLHIARANGEGEIDLPWARVQQRILQLIRSDSFYTQEEQDRLDDVDPTAIRERLAQVGIVNGEVVDPDALERDPFIQQVEADASILSEESGVNAQEIEPNSDTVGKDIPEDIPSETGANAPYKVGDTVYLDDTAYEITEIGLFDVHLQDNTLRYPISRAENRYRFDQMLRWDDRNAQFFESSEPAETPAPNIEVDPVSAPESQPVFTAETEAVYPATENNLPFDIVVERLHIEEPEHDPPAPPTPTAANFRILDDHLGEGGPKAKFRANIDAINTLKTIELEGRSATPAEQEILSRYVGWGGLSDAFDLEKPAWASEYSELKDLLTDEEYTAARASTLNAHYTSPTVIRAMYEALGNMGFQAGNILEPSMGVGNFFGMLPESMQNSRLYGVELDSITGRIAKQLYPQADITVAGFETTDRRDFFDLAVGNVPFGNYQVDDRAYKDVCCKG